MTSLSNALPAGVMLRPLVAHTDLRGEVTEVFRQCWAENCEAKQWNVAHSHAGTLRGVHVHARHADYLVLIAGTMLLGLHDLRGAGHGASCLLTLEASRPQAILIPPGVCHGFYFAQPATYLYGLSEYWDPAEELGCRFDDPELGLDWPDRAPVLSPRDDAALGYAQMQARFQRMSGGLRAREQEALA